MNWYNNLDIWAIAISFLAFAGSLFTYLSHDRKIKRQEAKINEYQLTKIREEESEKKRALVSGTIIRNSNGERTLKIENKGKATATNITAETKDLPEYCLSNITRHYMLNAQESFEIPLYLYYGQKSTINITYHWDDENSNNNKFKQVLSVL